MNGIHGAGDLVLLSTKNLNLKIAARKLLCKFVGPFEVLAPPEHATNPNVLWLKTPDDQDSSTKTLESSLSQLLIGVIEGHVNHTMAMIVTGAAVGPLATIEQSRRGRPFVVRLHNTSSNHTQQPAGLPKCKQSHLHYLKRA